MAQPKRIKNLRRIDSTTYGFEVGKGGHDDDVTVGGSDPTKFKPKVKLSRWKWGRAPANFDIALKTQAVGSHSIRGGKVSWQTPDFDFDVYGLEPEEIEGMEADGRGGIEFELVLKKKPPTNKFEWTIDTPDLKWFYQSALTQEEIDEGLERPDNVVGSYAVYHKTRCDAHKDPLTTPANLGIMGMKTKAFHVYRPYVVDNIGNETWGELDLNAGVLTVSVDQTWLDNATYPVVIDPTFGFTSIGETKLSGTTDRIWGTKGNPGENGDVTRGSFYTSRSGPGGNPLFRSGIYLVSNNSLVGNSTSSTTVSSTSESWLMNTYTGPSVSNQDYYVSTFINESANYTTRHDDGGDADQTIFSNATPFVWEEPLTGSDIQRFYSMYATYTATGGAAVTSAPRLLSSIGAGS